MADKILVEIDRKIVGPLLQTKMSDVLPQGNILEVRPALGGRPTAPMQTLPSGPSLFLCGAFPSAQFPMWTQALARNDSMSKDVGLILVQTGKKTATRTDLLQCMIKDVTLPALDKTSSAEATMKVTVIAEAMKQSEVAVPLSVPQLKLWTIGGFELTIADMFSATMKVQKVEAFSIGQMIKTGWTGADRAPRNYVNGVSVSNLVITLPTSADTDLAKWMQDIVTGVSNTGGRLTRPGQLRYLAADRSEVMVLEFHGLIPVSLGHSGPNTKVEFGFDRVVIDR